MQTTTAETPTGQDNTLVTGSYVATKPFHADIFAGFKRFFGLELSGRRKMLAKARKKAVERMEAEAEKLGADHILKIRFETTELEDESIEVFVFGTAARGGNLA